MWTIWVIVAAVGLDSSQQLNCFLIQLNYMSELIHIVDRHLSSVRIQGSLMSIAVIFNDASRD